MAKPNRYIVRTGEWANPTEQVVLETTPRRAAVAYAEQWLSTRSGLEKAVVTVRAAKGKKPTRFLVFIKRTVRVNATEIE